MLVLGIDPGTAICGYGLVEYKGSKFYPRGHGVITTTPSIKMEYRLLKIHNELEELIVQNKPSVIGVEQLFFNRNATTAIPVGQARGIIMLLAAKHKLELVERTPLQVKQAVTGYGKANKAQVIYMVTRLLNMSKPPTPDDVSDALAVAIATIQVINNPMLLGNRRRT